MVCYKSEGDSTQIIGEEESGLVSINLKVDKNIKNVESSLFLFPFAVVLLIPVVFSSSLVYALEFSGFLFTGFEFGSPIKSR